MDIVLTLHSLVRWLLLLVAVVALVKFTLGYAQKQPFRPMDRGLMSAFTGLMDSQVLLGLILLFGLGGINRFRMEHAVAMLIAVVLAHLPMRWREAPDSTRFRNNLLVIIGVLVLVVAGISVLPGNRWSL